MQAIRETRGRAKEYSFLACDPYWGACPFKCSYCYVCGMMHRNRDQWEKVQFGPRKGFLEALRRQAPQFAHDDRRVLLSFSSDVYAPGATITRQVLEVLREHDIPWQVLTKAGMAATVDFDLYGPHDAFATTLVFMDEAKRKEYEPGAVSFDDRFRAIRQARRMGIERWVSLEPVLDPTESLRIIEETHDFVGLYKVGKLNHDKAVEAGIDWGRFGWQAVELCDKYGVPYYVKEDLRRHMMDVGQAAPRNTDTRKVVR